MNKKFFNKVLVLALSLVLPVIPAISSKVFAADDTETPIMTVEMTNELGGLLHGASGFLYGASSEDVPTKSLITPLKSKVLATKGALGTEHPYADALDVAKTFLESGGEQVQMYNSNYYAIFQPKQSYQDYIVQLKEVIVPYVTKWKNKWKEEHNHNPVTGYDDLGLNIDKALVYLPINEADSYRGTTNGSGLPWPTLDGFKGNSTVNGQDFRQVFEAYYKAIKEVDPLATVGGINPAEYSWLHVPPQWGWDSWHTWLSYLYERDVMPDVITWHQLERNESRYEADIREFEHYRSIFAGEGNTGEFFGKVNNVNVDKIPADPPPVVINEIAQSDECGVPGALVSWIGRLEDAQAYGCLPFWHQANNLNDLAADANEPNGAWWLYKWYGDMSGQRLKINTENTPLSGLYGLSTIDDEKKVATTLFGLGSEDGNAKVVLKDLDKTNAFMNAKKVNVKIEAAYFKGYNSVSFPETVLEGTFALENGDLNIEMSDILRSTGYQLIVTPAAETDKIGNTLSGPFHGIYEAEEATRIGSGNLGVVTSSKYFLSGSRVSEWTSERNNIGGSALNNFTNNRGIEYTIDVPSDGKYKLEFIYGNQVGMNRGNESQHKPTNQIQQLTIDGTTVDMILKNTMEKEWTAIYTKYVDWEAGTHKVSIMGNTATQEGNIMQDALHVTYDGIFNVNRPAFDKVYEAEAADFAFNALHPGVNPAEIKNSLAGYTGDGYVTGLNKKSIKEGGGIRWNVIVEESGLYNVSSRYQSTAAGKATIYIGNGARTFKGFKKEVDVVNTGGTWTTANVIIYLQKGINILDLNATANIALDSLNVRKSDNIENYYQEVQAVDAIPPSAKQTDVEYDVWSVQWNENYVDKDFAGLLDGAEPFITKKQVNKTETTVLTPNGEEISYVVGRSLTGDSNANSDADKYLEFKVEVPDAGTYALQIFHSNDEIFGTHGYNTKIIDKFANIKVNDQPAQRYFFINTISRDTFKEKSVYLDLVKGSNTIKIFNDDSWTVMKGLDDGQAKTAGLPDWRIADPEEEPSGNYSSYYFDKPGNIPIVNSLPNFSKFVIMPAALDVVEAVTKITLRSKELSLVAKGAKGTLEATIQPINATNQKVKWTSSVPAVATVVNGVVTPLTEGKTTITATSDDNPALKDECIVTVTAASTGVTGTVPKVLKKGNSFQFQNLTYKIMTMNAKNKSGTVQVVATSRNKNLKTINIPNTVSNAGITFKVVEVATNAFKNNKKVTTVKIGKNVQEIKNGAFSGCNKMKKVTTGSNLTKIGKNVFFNNKKLKTIDLRKSKKLTSVGSKTFKGILKSATVRVPKGKIKTYKKLLKKGGLVKSAKIKR